jgi:hypothetical protein
VGSGLRFLQDYVVNFSVFEEQSMIDESDGVRNEIYHRVEDRVLVFVKSVGSRRVLKNRELRMNLRI